MTGTIFTTITATITEGVFTLTLNRPDSLNSFNTVMHSEVREAIATAEADSAVRAMILTGAGRGFCAGQDLSDRAVAPGSAPVDLGASIDTYYNPLVRKLRSLRMPVLCAVNGVAAGAGANIALACDIVFAAKSASFIQPFCNIGLVPDSGGTYMLPRLIGAARATALAMLGEKLPAEKAAEWGLIWQAVEDNELMATVNQVAQRMAGMPTLGLAAIKKAINASGGNSLDAQLELERDLQREMGFSEDYKEGVGAFLEKRKPSFKGR